MVGRIRSEQMSQIPRDQNPLQVKDDLQFEFAFLFHKERGAWLIFLAYFASQASQSCHLHCYGRYVWDSMISSIELYVRAFHGQVVI